MRSGDRCTVLYARFRKGDSFVASGYVHEYEVEVREGSVVKEEFVARKIGHNVNKTAYEVQRRRLNPTAPPPQASPELASVEDVGTPHVRSVYRG